MIRNHNCGESPGDEVYKSMCPDFTYMFHGTQPNQYLGIIKFLSPHEITPPIKIAQFYQT